MFDADQRQPDKRARSLLSLGVERSGEPEPRRGASLLAVEPGRGEDFALRHRLARSRRAAEPSPLLAALAKSDMSAQPVVANDTSPVAAPAEIEHAGWGITNMLPKGLRRSLASGEQLGNEPRGRAGTAAHEGPAAEAPVASPAAPAQPIRVEKSGPVEPFFTDDRVDDQSDDRWQPLIDPMKVIMGVVNARMLILAAAIVGVLIGVAVALSTPKKYEAATELLVDPRDLQLTDRNLTQEGLPSDATLALVENQVRVIMSGTVLNQVVDELNLGSDPEFNGKGEGGIGIGGVISAIRGLLSSADVADGDSGHVMAVGNLAEALSVERGGKTFVIVIAAKTRSPEKSALIANTMAKVFLATYGKIQSDTAGRATSELNARLEELRAGLEAAERKVEAFKAENDIVDAQGKLITDEEILKLNDQLSVARARTIELNARAASSKGIDVDAAIGGTLPEELSSGVMTELRSQYASLKQEADRAASRLGPRHPERIAAEAQLAGARTQIANELRRIVSSTQTELKRAVQLEQELSARLAQLKVRQGGLSSELVTLRELEREANAKRAVYEAFLLRARETAEQMGMNTANISIISQAYPPLDPTGPSRSSIAVVGLILGAMAGVGLGAGHGAWRSLRENATTRSRRNRPSRHGPSGAQSRAAGYETANTKPALPDTIAAQEQEAPDAGLVGRVRRRPVTARKGEEPRPAVRVSAPETVQAGEPLHAPLASQQPQPVYVATPTVQPPVYAQPVPPAPLYYPQPVMPGYAMPGPYAHAAYPYLPPAPAPWPAYAAQPAPVWPQQPFPAQQAVPAQQQTPEPAPHLRPVDRQPLQPQTPIEEVRGSLRDFREAVRELTASRSGRRYY